jgi:Protein of unknown function (DUF2950)
MRYVIDDKEISAMWIARFPVFLALVLALASCSRSESATDKDKTDKKEASHKTFASPAEAGATFLEAAKSGDQGALLAIFGPDGKDVLFSGDAAKDKTALQDFVAAYNQMHRWREIKVGGQMLSIGADNYLFPIPLGQNSSGQWYFDTAAGNDEVLARRIGKDELTALAACSEPARAISYATVNGTPQQFSGYYFRIIPKQGAATNADPKKFIVNGRLSGGAALLAYPADYRNSGIMTFLVGNDGVIYQKDLGEKSKDAAAALAEYNPRDGWSPAI